MEREQRERERDSTNSTWISGEGEQRQGKVDVSNVRDMLYLITVISIRKLFSLPISIQQLKALIDVMVTERVSPIS